MSCPDQKYFALLRHLSLTSQSCRIALEENVMFWLTMTLLMRVFCKRVVSFGGEKTYVGDPYLAQAFKSFSSSKGQPLPSFECMKPQRVGLVTFPICRSSLLASATLFIVSKI